MELEIKNICIEFMIKLLEQQSVSFTGTNRSKVKEALIENCKKILKDKKTLNDVYETIDNIVKQIDDKREKLKEKYKKSYQYKSCKRYKINDQRALACLAAERNALVMVLNYIYTGDVKELEDLIK